MTQHKLIIRYIDEYGSILPAKMAGAVYKGKMFGSETSARCRELRQYTLPSVQKYPKLDSVSEGRFERFYFAGMEPIKKELTREQVEMDLVIQAGG